MYQNSERWNMCLELALEGERLCKAGDCKSGVAFFQAAIQAGTDDLRTLSAIYSQLGNAYFYLGDYVKAMQYHKLDLTLARNMGDKLGEAKSSGNLGNTLKVMGKFDEAMICCKRHLEISREIGDKVYLADKFIYKKKKYKNILQNSELYSLRELIDYFY